jgi:hypothetical protein
LPVKSGEKVGLNIWTWDSAWKEPTVWCSTELEMGSALLYRRC